MCGRISILIIWFKPSIMSSTVTAFQHQTHTFPTMQRCHRVSSPVASSGATGFINTFYWVKKKKRENLFSLPDSYYEAKVEISVFHS